VRVPRLCCNRPDYDRLLGFAADNSLFAQRVDTCGDSPALPKPKGVNSCHKHPSVARNVLIAR
jgi:hypothetical protein